MRSLRFPAAALAALGILHLVGGRPATAALSGIASGPFEGALGLAYVALWLVCCVVVPAWLLAVALDRSVGRAAGQWLRSAAGRSGKLRRLQGQPLES